MGRHENDSSANERSVALKKRKRWRRPSLRFLRAWGGGGLTGGHSRNEAVSEASVEDARQHVGELLEILLNEKAKNLGSMIHEMTQRRTPTLRKAFSRSFGDKGIKTLPVSSTSSADSMSTCQRSLERMDSSMMERDETIETLRRGKFAHRGTVENKAMRPHPRHVESETNESLPQVNRRVCPPLQVHMDSGGGMSLMMDTPLTETLTPAMIPLLSLPLISYEDLQVKSELGRGQFASVKLSLWKGVEVAMKEWHALTDRESMHMADQEGTTLACLRHPCVVSFYGMLDHGPSPGLVVEYLPHLSLKSKLTQLKGTDLDTKKLKVAVALRAARGMEFLHSRKVIHFDLKCDNLLCDLRDLDNPVVKIGDVGLSKEKMKTYVSGNMRGTLPWMAPELFPSVDRVGSQGNITDLVNEKVDIYSFGVVLWEIWEMGEAPYPELEANQLLDGILKRNLRLARPRDCDPIWVDVMYACLKKQPEDRPDFPTIISQLELLSEENIHTDG